MEFEIRLLTDDAQEKIVYLKEEIEQSQIEGIENVKILEKETEENSMGSPELTDILSISISSGLASAALTKLLDVAFGLLGGIKGPLKLSHKCGDKEISWEIPVNSKQEIRRLKTEFDQKIKEICGNSNNIIIS